MMKKQENLATEILCTALKKQRFFSYMPYPMSKSSLIICLLRLTFQLIRRDLADFSIDKAFLFNSLFPS